MNLTFETARAHSELFAFQCSQWELIWNSQLIGRYQEMSPGDIKKCHQVNLTCETARAQSELFAFLYGQWELIWNSQLIGRYQEMSPGESYNIPPLCNWQSSEWALHFSMQSMRAHLKQSTHRKISRNVTRWYKEMSPGESYMWNCQSTEWTLRFSLWSMRAHLKQSTHRKISRNVTRWILQYTPPLQLAELRVSSSLFNAVNESSFETVN